MVLGGDNHAAHARRLEHAHPLFAVEARGVEGREGRVAVAPFAVHESVGTEVYEGVSLHLLPCHLMLGGQRADGRGRRRLSDGRESHAKAETEVDKSFHKLIRLSSCANIQLFSQTDGKEHKKMCPACEAGHIKGAMGINRANSMYPWPRKVWCNSQCSQNSSSQWLLGRYHD